AAPFAAFFKTKTMQELYEAACERRLMLAPANTEREVLGSRQLDARSLFTEIGGPDGKPMRVPSHFSEWKLTRVRERFPSPDGAKGGGPAAPSFGGENPLPGPLLGKGGGKTGSPLYQGGVGGGSPPPRIFTGLKVLEFGAGAAAPLATRYFADQGATVV